MAIDGALKGPLLSKDSLDAILTAPIPGGDKIGLRWTVQLREHGVDYWHTGALRDSNVAWLARTADGVALAFVFNSAPADLHGFFVSMLPGLLDALGAIGEWPEHDLFCD